MTSQYSFLILFLAANISLTLLASVCVWAYVTRRAKDGKLTEFQIGSVLVYKRMGNRLPKNAPKIEIHSKTANHYIARVRAKGSRTAGSKLYRINVREATNFLAELKS
jgi:6-pyruvoyl-tetrahydropterin synthase